MRLDNADFEENVICVNNVKKKFKIFFDKGQSLKDRILFKNRNSYENRWVLKGISFNVKKGEAIGLIGENGCGKSTLLKLLTKIMYPDAGSIEIKGRVSSLIELGAGFHPDMTGRENIYINASIFGLTRKEIDQRVHDIIEFSELNNYIDNPVRTYSSGMYMRLAFAVAINVNAEILLIDEILAVGDANFQAKCFNKMRQIKENGTTIVIVSHALSQIEQICDRAYWINEGVVRKEGKPHGIIQEYMSWIMSKSSFSNDVIDGESQNSPIVAEELVDENISNGIYDYDAMRKTKKPQAFGNKDLLITKITMKDGKTGVQKDRFSIDDELCITINYIRVNNNLKEFMCSFMLLQNSSEIIYATNSLIDTGNIIESENEGVIKLYIKPIQLLQGEYTVDITLNKDYGPDYYGIINALHFTIYNTKTDYGIYRISHNWEVQ